MAGAKLEIEVDDAAVLGVLQQAQSRLSPDGMGKLLGEIGQYLFNATQERAATETGPDGERWPALSPRYLKRKQKRRPNAPLLVFDRHMLGDQLATQVVGYTVYVGTNAPYGARQQFGGGGIPARPWLGVSDADAVEIQARTLAFIRKSLDGDA